MKTIYSKLLLLLLMLPFSMLAQSTLKGVVSDATSGQPIPGANVVVEGSTNGTSTDMDGNFTLPNVKAGDRLVFSFLGYSNQVIAYTGQPSINVSLQEDATQLQEVIVIGYGTTTKKDATGAVTVVSSKDFNKGAIANADQLLTGRSPGVRITNAGGQPDAAPNIRIRGGSSISAQNNPLIVIDGVPIDFVNPAGVGNPLSILNPNDIESFTVLKDASATAIYGSRASNGVIIVTTKKGASGAPKFSFSTNVAIGNVGKKINVMDGNTFARYAQEYFGNNAAVMNKLGVDDPTTDAVDNPATAGVVEGRILYNTDWQDAIYRTSIMTDNNFSASGKLFNAMPVRASIGYMKNEGLIKTNDYERYTGSLKLSPSFLDDHLKFDINLKGTRVQKNAVDEGGALAGALNMDPTKPIYGNGANTYGGYYQNTTIVDGLPTDDFDGQYNPVNLLNERRRPENVDKLLGNIQMDYKFHWLPELRAIVNAGLEGSRADMTEKYTDRSFASYQLVNDGSNTYVFNPGVNYRETQHITNKTLDTYLAYTKNLDGFITRVDGQAGHTYQSFVNDGYKNNYRYNVNTGLREEVINAQNPNNRYYNKTVLESYFGRLNVDFADKYLLTVSMRADGSSLFKKDNRWAYFPAAALAWRITDENFLKDSKTINTLKLRLGYGQTGQQDITGIAGYYPTSALFEPGSVSGQYLPGYNTYNPLAFNDKLKWETTTTYNVGLDFGFMKDIISGSVDVYKRDTKDLLVRAAVPPGQYLTNQIVQNVGSLTNKGVEVDLKVRPITTDTFSWEVLGNISYNLGKITNLGERSAIDATESGLPVQTGLYLAQHTVGQQPYSAYVFEQLYDNGGNAIPGAFKDRNGDGVIDNNDKYYQSLRPNWTFGFSTTFTYKDFDLTASFHGQLDGKVYNSIKVVGGWRDRILPNNTNSLNNALNFYEGAADPAFTNILGNVPLSDYYLENAAFLRCDNITLGYRIKDVVKNGSIRIYAAVNNAFLVTKYSGQDPENFNALDNNFYPRPRLYSFGLNFDF